MNSKYKVITVFFILDRPYSPFRIVNYLEDFYQTENCVLAIKAFCGDMFTCTFAGDYVVSRVKAEKSFVIDKKTIKFKEVDSSITCIKIEKIPHNLAAEDIHRVLRSYAYILKYDIQRSNGVRYYAIIDHYRDIPSRLKFKTGFLEIEEVK